MAIRLIIAVLALYSLAHAGEADPYDCFGAGRYQAMSEGKVCPDYPDLPAGITCEMIRNQVAAHGRKMARTWARLQGYSAPQIREAEKCLR